MLHRLLADAVAVLHLLFVAFAVMGGLLALRWRWLPCLHLPALAWAATVEFTGWICPLTPLENRLRMAGGAAGYSGGFVDHYLLPLLYPASLDRETQLVLGLGLLAINAVAYWLVWRRRARRLG
jgi:hypothetical protein